MSEQWQAPPPYLAAPPKKRGTFWKVTTVIVLVAALALAGWTWVRGGFSGSTTPTASTIDAANETGSATTANTTATQDPQSDADNDGLKLLDEERYGTNPTDPDSDKDGYSDGQEVLNGYNPNGAGRLTVEAKPTQPTNEDPNRKTLSAAPTMTGTPLTEVYSGQGSYQCRIEGGQQEKNVVTVKVKNNKVRQETPVNGSTMVFIIVDQKTLYLSSFEGSKFLELNFTSATATASGNGATIRGGIFANENLVLAANPTSIDCQPATLADKDFDVPAEQILKLQ
ncbi:MAG: thrombospondin type 3 repeat-containing protein [Candidatus Andersenbacteria bacterium]